MAKASTSAAPSTQGVKRSFNSMTAANSNPPATLRDARKNPDPSRSLDTIQPARNFAKKYVDFDFSKMTDTKGGFLTKEDDPFNKALNVSDGKDDKKPAHMTQKEWERHQLDQFLRRNRQGPYEPGLSVLDDKNNQKKCRECGSVDIDWKWEAELKCCICNSCKEKFPDKYNLLTKTEAKEDYLLTDRGMMLFLRYQVEEYAFSERKWGSAEALDAEFEQRENDKKKRREDKFQGKLKDLKKRTRTEAYRRRLEGASGNFGDDLSRNRKHVHKWGRAVDNEETGMPVKTCVDCGMEVEELEF
ncbi:hypothetical protein N7495_001390 [Penicillium taxi]|uniref:uncharacterized protein n=1 Tax=Penicillium taxi TaxID=168475 RepID=UPI00254522E5|nr:uncharacterized protein N7495_001390 [Penicillium taxi]KAJ5908708.1 hypothetical protein N7495_001390 [Penicillium taxi]